MFWQNDEYAFADQFFGMLREAYEDQPYLNKPYTENELNDPAESPHKRVEKIIKKTGPKNKKGKYFKF